MIKEMMTRKEAQEALRVGRLTMYAWIEKGYLNGVRVGKKWLIPVEEVERLQRGDRPATAAQD